MIALFNSINYLRLSIISPNFNRGFDSKIFSRDGVHFPTFCNFILTRSVTRFFFQILPNLHQNSRIQNGSQTSHHTYTSYFQPVKLDFIVCCYSRRCKCCHCQNDRSRSMILNFSFSDPKF